MQGCTWQEGLVVITLDPSSFKIIRVDRAVPCPSQNGSAYILASVGIFRSPLMTFLATCMLCHNSVFMADARRIFRACRIQLTDSLFSVAVRCLFFPFFFFLYHCIAVLVRDPS